MKLSEYMVKENLAEESEKEIIDFGMEMLKTIVIGTIVATILGMSLGMFWENCFFLFALMPLRQYAGGFHLKSRVVCGIVSTLVLAGSLLMFKYVSISDYGQILMYFVGAFCIVRFAPVENPERILDDDELRVFGERAKTVLMLESFLFLILLALKLSNWSMIIVWSIDITAILVVLGYLRMKIL